MKYFTSILLLLCSIMDYAQNYNCLQSGQKKYFINGNGYVRGIRIDSVGASGGDVIYYPYRTKRMSNYLMGMGGASAIGGSWLGKKVIRHADGTYLFDNLWDTVIIKTQANPGDSWLFFNDTTNLYYTATVTSADTMTIMGTPDSIKRITITADSAGIVHPIDPVNNFQIILSKNHGFVQVFDLYTFPYHRPDTMIYVSPHAYRNIRFIDYYLDVVLGNMGSCDLGCSDNPPDTNNSVFHLFSFYNPTHADIYDFAVGDVFESHFSVNSYMEPYYYQAFTLDSILTKTVNPSNLAYTGHEHAMVINMTSTYPTFAWDTTYVSNPFNAMGDTSVLINMQTMPEEWNAGNLFHYFPKSIPLAPLCDSPAAYEIDVDYKGTGFGYDGTVYRASSSSTTYSMGYGLTGKSVFDAIAGQEQNQGYVYYKKNTSTCGTFINVLKPGYEGVKNINPDNVVSISPNPANDQLKITINRTNSNNTFISVYDMSGRCIYRTDAGIQNELAINTSSWIDGLYMVIVQDNEGIVKKEKVVIRK